MKKVVLGLSGGIDSAVAASLLKEQGYEVIAVSFKFWEEENDFYRSKALFHQRKDALHIAQKLDLAWMESNATPLFKETVIEPFAKNYLQGKTPNPCIDCNPLVKWNLLDQIAQQLHCNYVATGHYAGRIYQHNKWLLAKGKDRVKDQSYMLWKLWPQQIEKTLFPLSGLLKYEVKQIAQNIGLSSLAEKRESYNICFLPGRNYKGWLCKQYGAGIFPGMVLDESENYLGKHSGIALYTVGEELSFLTVAGKWFVKEIIPSENTIIASSKEKLYTCNLNIIKPVFYIPELFFKGNKIMVRIRGKECEHETLLEKITDEFIILRLFNPVFAPSPGQAAVLYSENCIVGGGEIA